MNLGFRRWFRPSHHLREISIFIDISRDRRKLPKTHGKKWEAVTKQWFLLFFPSLTYPEILLFLFFPHKKPIAQEFCHQQTTERHTERLLCTPEPQRDGTQGEVAQSSCEHQRTLLSAAQWPCAPESVLTALTDLLGTAVPASAFPVTHTAMPCLTRSNLPVVILLEGLHLH